MLKKFCLYKSVCYLIAWVEVFQVSSYIQYFEAYFPYMEYQHPMLN